MFDPETLPPPDESGCFVHPDVPGEKESDDVRALCRELGYDLDIVEFEYDATDRLHDDYYERDDKTAVGRWSPTPPDGEGWMLVAKYETESGPCACFVRPITGVPDATALATPESNATDAQLSAAPRWTFACTRCSWIGNDPSWIGVIGRYADCPECGNSCTTDEPEFEPRPGVQDGTADGFDPVWPRE